MSEECDWSSRAEQAAATQMLEQLQQNVWWYNFTIMSNGVLHLISSNACCNKSEVKRVGPIVAG